MLKTESIPMNLQKKSIV